MTTVLVTGGNIGNYVAEELARKKIPVRVLVRSVKPNAKWDRLGIEQVAGDVANPDSRSPAFQGVEQFFSVTPFVANLVELGTTAVEAAQKAGVRHIVRSSAMGASETGITMWRWHREVEKAVETSGIPYTILQPNTFMQSYLMNAESVKRDNAFYLPQGEGKVSLVDARDIAAVAVVALTESGHENKKYVITGGEALSNYDIADKLSKVLEKKVRYVDVDEKQAEESMLRAGLPDWTVKAVLELFEVSKAGQVAEVSSAVEQVVKRKPNSFDKVLTDNASSFREDRGIGAA